MAGAGEFAQLLFGVCAGALLAMAAAMLRAPRPAARWTGFAFFFASSLYAIKQWDASANALPDPLHSAIGVVAITSIGSFWLMVMALFQDRDAFKPWMFAAPAVMTLCGAANLLGLKSASSAIWVLTSLLQLGLAGASLLIIVQSWKDDLVEQRRQVRGPFMFAVALYIMSLTGFELWDVMSRLPDWYPTLNAALFAAVVLAGAFVFLDPRDVMFGEQPAAASGSDVLVANGHQTNGAVPETDTATPPGLDRAARAVLAKLDGLMRNGEVWREEGLSISSLAVRVGVPEHQLRRLINDHLGYRNFPGFINAHRIAAAKHRLADPDEARTSVSAIAFDLGFASLGPFNRAFREETGVSPTQWRKNAFEDASPEPGES
jgi:AraC-like DNA-binding protein